MDYKERLVYLKKKLSKMDDQFVIAEDENGIFAPRHQTL